MTPSNRSRRQFLQRLALSGAALATGFGHPARLPAQTTDKPPKKLGVALLGLV
jgi:hypothetical protein